MSQILLKSFSVSLLLICSLALQAQEEISLILTNHASQAIWVDKVFYGNKHFPVGYLPPGGRTYLPLATSRIQPLQLLWHHLDDKSKQQQTLRLKPALTTDKKTSRYFVLSFDGQLFRQMPSE